METHPNPIERRAALAVMAQARTPELRAAWDALETRPDFTLLRRPEIGMVMARGRIGGGGAPFNLGEVTVSRAAVRMESGEIGHGHVLGRDVQRAELVARFDALWQSAKHRERVTELLLQPVSRRIAEEDALTRRKTEATRVNFFTMVRGEYA